MEEEEEEECNDQASSYSWWWDSHNNPHHSQWLQATLSDLDKKIKMMLNLIEEDGDSFGKRAEMYYQKRPELIKIIEDLHKSYRFLAEKYDQLRSDCTKLPADEHSSTPFENFIKQVQHPPGITSSSTTSSELTSTKPNSLENGIGDVDMEIDGEKFDRYKRRGDLGSWKREEMWNELLRLKASKLVEDNLMQQAELVRRNDEKRKNIKALCIHINRLMEENKALKSHMAAYADVMKPNQSPMSKIKQLILGKLSDKLK